ncbi:sulfur carrier protein ThiS [Alphaproteobacteria bacterium]|nr:sulfur carrier protein ThiS [Alphaproteobacteria bacterium]
MQITINGQKYQFENQISINDLLNFLKIDSKKVAFECNLEIIPKSQYNSLFLKDNDKVEIVHFIGGG